MKTCSCGKTYTKAQWQELKLLGYQEDLELRNCSRCHTTLAKTSPSALHASVGAKTRPEAGPKRVPPSVLGPAGEGPCRCRCRITIQEGVWTCQTFGCGAKGTVGPHQLVRDDGKWINRPAPGPHPAAAEEKCLFDMSPRVKRPSARGTPIEHSIIRVETKPNGLPSRTWISDWPSFSEAREEAKKLKGVEVVPAWKWHNGES